jgi:hypothetical protein
LISPGDVVRVKISNETVFVQSVTNSSARVLRAVTTRDGVMYVSHELPPDALESVEESIQREFKEALYRHNLACEQLGVVDEPTPGIVQ